MVCFLQVELLTGKCQTQEADLQLANQKAQEAMGLAAEEAAKSRAAKEVIKSLTAQVRCALYLFMGSQSIFCWLKLWHILDTFQLNLLDLLGL